MYFTLLRHEEDAIEFYEKIISETDDVEIKKQALKHHYDFLVSIHLMEREYRTAEINRELAQDNNNLEHKKIREDSRRKGQKENPDG